MILFQYHDIANVDAVGNYATVGIESPTQAFGLEYSFANKYPPSAAPLAPGLAIRFTPDRPDTFGTDVEETSPGSSPVSFVLSQNYPNPFNPSTAIHYSLPVQSRKLKVEGEGTLNSEPSTFNVSLKIYNILGQEVRTLVDEEQESGSYVVTWDGRDTSGKEVFSGVYIYQLEWGGVRDTRRMILIK
jgi:hypothetical protein